MNHLILMRHGQSVWNLANLFTGWVDVPLSAQGVEEAVNARALLAKYPIDVIYTSTLVRALMTALLAMIDHPSKRVPCVQHTGSAQEDLWSLHEGAGEGLIPVYCDKSLNERMYGKLQGLNKDETVARYGQEQVHQWRRSYDIAPPGGESLKMTAERSIPYFQQKIVPSLQQGKTVLVAAHGNSLRSIVMHLESLSKEEVLKLELSTGEPRVYSYNQDAFTLL